MGIPGDYGPQNIPPTTLFPELSTYNAFLSLVQHVSVFLDRTKFPADQFPLLLTDKILTDEFFEGKKNKGWISLIAKEFKGGKGKEVSTFIVRLCIKEEEDWGYEISMPLADEIIRLFEAAPIFYDFADQENPVPINRLFLPCIYEEAPFSDDTFNVAGLRVVEMSYQVKIPRVRSTFEIAQ
jgi:hypothetical protein